MILKNLTLLFVTHRPDSEFASRIQKLSREGLNIVLFSNCPFSYKINMSLAQTIPNVFFFGGERNVGLSKAYNYVCNRLKQLGFDRFVIFDQDTKISSNFFKSLSFIKSASLYDYSILQLQSKVNNSATLEHFYSDIVDTDFVINSGSIVNIDLVSSIGGFNESFFVDLVDYELCVRSRVLGYRVGVVIGDFGIDHSTLQADSRLVFFGRHFFYRSYSGSRIKEVLVGGARLVKFCAKRGCYKLGLSLIRFMLVFIFKNAIGLLLINRK